MDLGSFMGNVSAVSLYLNFFCLPQGVFLSGRLLCLLQAIQPFLTYLQITSIDMKSVTTSAPEASRERGLQEQNQPLFFDFMHVLSLSFWISIGYNLLSQTTNISSCS
jgi:hypothetical protein